MDEDPIDSVVRAQLGCQEIADYCQQGPFCSDRSPLSTLYFPLFAFNLVFFCLLLWSRSCDNDTLVLPVSRVCFLVIDRHIIHIDLPSSPDECLEVSLLFHTYVQNHVYKKDMKYIRLHSTISIYGFIDSSTKSPPFHLLCLTCFDKREGDRLLGHPGLL